MGSVRRRRPPSPTLPPQTARGKGASVVHHPASVHHTACHPEAQERRTGPHTPLCGPKDPAADTYKPGRGSGHRLRGLGCRGALTRPRLGSSTLSHKQRGRGGTLQARLAPKPLVRTRLSSGVRGAPPMRRVHPQQGSPRRRTSCGCCSEFIRPCRPWGITQAEHSPPGLETPRLGAWCPLPRPGIEASAARSFGAQGSPCRLVRCACASG